MATKPRTHYEVLGVKPDAKQTDIGRAYNKWKSKQADETAAPDPRGAAVMEAAYKVLGNPESRDAYDRELAGPQRKRQMMGMTGAIAGVVVLSATAAGAWLMMGSKPNEPSGPPGKSPDEIRHVASLAVGRLDRVDMSGSKAQVGLAFAIAEDVMVAPCNAIVPGAQHMVFLSPRNLPARVRTADEHIGLCQLTVDGTGSKPLTVAGVEPRPGDKVYSTKINAVGEVMITEGAVKRVTTTEAGRVIEASVPVAPSSGGAPLLDIYARVVGVAAIDKDGRAQHVPVPKGWDPDAKPRPAPAPAATAAAGDEDSGAPKQRSEPRPAPGLRNPSEISEERKKRLGEAFRPPPNVPDDL
jgi:trypsin-like peptidase/DnaJ-like protein